MAEPFQEFSFWLFATVMVLCALRVVTSRNVVHAALWLAGTLLAAAAFYVLLFAEFVAWAQVLVYVGAVVVLMLFGLMFTRAPIGSANFDNDQRLLAAVCAGALFAVTSWVLIEAFSGERIDFQALARAGEQGTAGEFSPVRSVGEVIFSLYVLPFEVVSVLLLAALVGAIVIARRDDR